MARVVEVVVLKGMPETAVIGGGGEGGGAGEGRGGGGVMLRRRKSRVRRRKRKELFGVQLCVAATALALVAGLQSVSRGPGEGAAVTCRETDRARA